LDLSPRAALFELLKIGAAVHAPFLLFAATDVDVADFTIVCVARQSLDRDAKVSGGHLWR
jgi:hypothetical protein